jgi:hypothetical protein
LRKTRIKQGNCPRHGWGGIGIVVGTVTGTEGVGIVTGDANVVGVEEGGRSASVVVGIVTGI